MAVAYKFALPITTEEDLDLFVQASFGIRIPKVKVCENHVAPWTAFCDAYFARHSIAVWKASRGLGGKSFTLATLGTVEALTLKANVNILGGSGEQSKRILEASEKLWGSPSAPRTLLASDPASMHTSFVWKNTMRALMASQTSVRGPHPEKLRLDEVDEMAIKIFDAAMGQTMERAPIGGEPAIKAQTVISSTHQNPDGTMTEVLRRAADRGWPVFEWCWRETVEPHGWLSLAEVERKRNEVTERMWEVEYDLQEPSAEGRAISTQAVEEMFRRDLGDHEGGNGHYVEAEVPQRGGKYAHGADWARKTDWTVVVTERSDVEPCRVVAWERCGRLDWPVMVGKFVRRIERYGGTAAHDGTGIGDVVAGYLPRALTAGDHPVVEGVMMVGRGREDLFSEYIAAIEHREIVSPMIAYAYNEHKYVRMEDLYGSGHPPDSIVAGALAHRAARKGRRAFRTIVTSYTRSTAAGTKGELYRDPREGEEGVVGQRSDRGDNIDLLPDERLVTAGQPRPDPRNVECLKCGSQFPEGRLLAHVKDSPRCAGKGYRTTPELRVVVAAGTAEQC
jgi:hypothetical protein